MSVNKYNCEGYRDSTVYQALTNINNEEKAERKSAFKPLVYICSPYAGDIENNVNKAKEFCRFTIENNGIPLAPHLLFPQFMNDEITKERNLAFFFNKVLLGKCNEVWVFGDVISKGMEIEIKKAKRRGQVLKYFNSKLEEVKDYDFIHVK